MRARLRQHIKLELPAHPRFKGFEAFAAREIFPWLAEKEAERREVVRRTKVIGFGTALGIALLQAVFLGLLRIDPTVSLIAFGAVPAILGFVAVFLPIMKFESGFKEFLLSKICEHLGLRHSGENPALPFERFMTSRLLPSHDERRFEDGTEAEGADIKFSAAEASLVRTRSGSDSSDSDETVWRGLLMEVPAPRRFAGRTLVMPARDKIEQFFDRRAAERIELRLGELEEGLEIRTTTPDEARAVLTERVMRRLAALAGRLGRERPTLALIDDSVLLAIKTDRDRFKAGSAFDPIDRIEYLDRILADFALLFELAEALHEALGRTPARRG